MGKPLLDEKIVTQIIELRRTGHSLPEIRKITGKGSATVFKYVKGVEILPEYIGDYKVKQGGSRKRASIEWEKATNISVGLIQTINKEQKLIILACLYWAEGRKSDFDIINSDPDLLRVFVNCLEELGVTKDKLRISIRTYSDINKTEVINFWKNTLQINENQIISVNVLSGKKEGKLKYGMCRVRITKGAEYYKLLTMLAKRIKMLV